MFQEMLPSMFKYIWNVLNTLRQIQNEYFAKIKESLEHMISVGNLG